MKKRLALFVAGLALAFTGVSATSHSAMLGGLAMPLNESEAAMSIVMAFTQRDVKDGVKDEATSRRFLFKGAYGLGNKADIYAFAGLTDLSYKEASFSGSLGESLGLGVRYAPAEFVDGSKFVLDFQTDYFKSDDGIKSVSYQMFRAAGYMVGKFGSSGKLGTVYPYGGLALSSASFRNGKYDDYKGESSIGLIAGTDFFVNPNVFFTLEFHLFDESAAYLSAGYHF